MDRLKLKNRAKEIIKGNLWYIWKPLVMVSLVAFVIGFVLGMLSLSISKDAGSTIMAVIEFIVSLFEAAFMIAFAKYILEFVRGNKMDWKQTLTYTKEHFWLYIGVTIVVGLIICAGSILLVIPGIIAAIGLMFYQEVSADYPELGVMGVVKKSWEITKGHKWDLFVLGLSFIGWAIVACLTLGILYIWLMPYMMVTMTLAYEELKK